MISKMIKGMGYLEGYGTHPGWPIVIAMSLLGFMMGIIPGLIHALMWFAMFAFGSYDRYRSWERYSANERLSSSR